ncbi:MAG TPA: ABC transporter ATP-binding protein/permease [Geminicoccaceae bacterium]|nr:ABC transporter ATP-binding protein/permease [Geminicoccaceae bacterium]
MAQLRSLWHALASSRHRRQVGLLAAGIVLVVCLNAVGQIRLNSWQGAFYDALEQKHMAAFTTQLLIFLIIAGGLLVLVVAQTWLQQMITVRLREWLAHDLLDQWLAPKRAYLLSFAGEIGVNPDQRIAQDALHASELTAILGVGLLQSSLLLVSFVGVLWILSANVVFELGGHSFAIPGYMVWCAIIYALGGSLLAWRVGRPLIPLNAERYQRESDLRFALVRVNEHADGIALHGGEADERRLLNEPVDRVITMMARLAGGIARLTWITSSYGWLAIVVPIVVAAPGYFGGNLSFGALMMVVGAFNQVQSSLRWFVDNLAQIADWRATLLRIVSFRNALPGVETIGEEAGRIAVVDAGADRLVLQDLRVALPGECAALDQARVEVAPGEHIQIMGEAGSGKSTLFRALAGMWPWGSGTIQLPPRDAMMFLPQRPYLPPGTLRAAVSYPTEPGHFGDAAIRAALERVDLGQLADSLDRDNRWDRVLPLDEQQRLAFARLLLHAPRWVFLDDAIGTLDETHQELVLSIFERELAGAAVIRFCRDPAKIGSWSRTVHLVQHPGGPCLLPSLQAAPEADATSAAANGAGATRGTRLKRRA